MDVNEEKKLVEKAKESLEAFDRLYEYYLPRIMSFVYNRCANREIAEDVTSQTFINAMLKLKTFDFRGYRFGAWLYRIAHNCLIDYFRANPNIFETSDKEALDSGDATELGAQDSERHKLILKALKTLPEQYQEVLSLRYFEEMSNEEMAEILGCNRETLAVKVHRSLKALKDALERENLLPALDIKNDTNG